MESVPDLSIVVPAYNEQDNIRLLYSKTLEAFAGTGIRCQIVFVDDGSTDRTLAEMIAVACSAEEWCPVTVVPFSRNFGKEAALYAGLEHARGDAVAFMDSDLQQPPCTLLEMYRLLVCEDAVDCVAAYQEARRESPMRNWLSRQFYRVLAGSSGMDVVSDASDFRVFTREVADALLSLPEYHRFTKGLFAWIGFKTLPFAYSPEQRNAGETSWSFGGLLKYALGGLVSFTTFPLKVSMGLGGAVSLAAVLYLVIVIVQRLAFGVDVPGYASIVTLILLFGGLQLFFLGIMGEYLGRTYTQGKHRPIYVCRKIYESANCPSACAAKGVSSHDASQESSRTER